MAIDKGGLKVASRAFGPGFGAVVVQSSEVKNVRHGFITCSHLAQPKVISLQAT